MDLPVPGRCGNPYCKNEATLRCNQCKDSRYCSAGCQKEDWRFHKLLCKKFASLQPRADPHSRRVILIAQGAPKVAFTTAPVTLRFDPDGDNSPATTTTTITPKPGDPLVFAAIHHNAEILGSDGRPQPLEELEISHTSVTGHVREASTLPNLCFNRLMRDQITTMVYGSLMLVAYTKLGDEMFVVDIDTRDFTRGLVLFARNHNSEAEASRNGMGGTD